MSVRGEKHLQGGLISLARQRSNNVNRVSFQIRHLKGALDRFDRHRVAVDSSFSNHIESCPGERECASGQLSSFAVAQPSTVGVETFERHFG